MDQEPQGLDDFIGGLQQPQGGPAPASTPSPSESEPQGIDDFINQTKEAQYGGGAQQFVSGIEGLAKGVAGPLATAAEVGLGVPREDILGRAETHPWTHGLSQTAGFVGGALTGASEAALVGKAGELAEAASGLGEAAGIGSKIASGVIKGATEASIIAAGDEASKAILQDPNQSLGSAAINVGLSGILGGGIGGTIGAVSPLWKATKEGPLNNILHLIKGDSEGVAENLAPQPGDKTVSPLLRKALTVFGGVSPDAIDAYVANADAIRAAPEYQEVYDHVLGHVQKLSDGLEASKENLSSAKSSYKDIYNDAVESFRNAGYDAARADQAAKAALKDAQTSMATEVQQRAISKAPAVANAVEGLRKNVVDGSRDAYELLGQTDKEISLKPLYNTARELQDKVYAQGSPLALQQAEALQKYVDTLGAQYGEKVSAVNAKSIIQGLDKLGAYNFNATAFDSGLSPVYNQMRHALDSTLKEAIPEYAKAMEPVAESSRLLKSLNRYGTPEDAVKSIVGLKNPARYTNEMPLLRRLEEHIGIKFTHDLEPYANKDLQEAMKTALPEYNAATKTADALAHYKNPATKAALEESLQLRPEAQAVKKAEERLAAAQMAKQELPGLTEGSLQGKLNSTMQGRNIAARAMLDKVPGMQGKSIPEILDLIRVRQAFERGATNGSRNVNLFGTIGGALGFGVAGPAGAAAGAGAGGILGGVVDKEGPALVQKLLDKYMGHFGNLPEAAGMSEEAAKNALQHVLGSNSEPNGAAFKASADYVNHVSKGMDALTKGTRALFLKGATIIPDKLYPSKDKIDRLDNRLKSIQANQQQMFQAGGQIGHYLPNHAQAISQTAMNAANTLNSARPHNVKQAPLDSEMPITQGQRAQYQRTLAIAQQPLIAVQHMKNYTLLPQDVATLKQIYPSLYDHMSQKIITAMTDHISKGESIPYKLTQSLSLFLGQPMSSLLQPQNIQAAQSVFMANQAAPQQQAQKSAPISKTSKLGKMASSYRTPEQAALSEQTVKA